MAEPKLSPQPPRIIDLQGGLTETEISELLFFLQRTCKTGELQLSELPVTGHAQLFFNQGHLVHALSSKAEGEAVLADLSHWQSGEARFIHNVLSPKTTINLSLEKMVQRAVSGHETTSPASAGNESDAGREQMKNLKELLTELVGIEGINTAVLVERDGFVIEGVVSSGSLDAEAIGAVISTGIGSSEVMGNELKVGQLHQTMVEYDNGIILINLVGESAILAVVAGLQTPLGNVRYQVKKRLPEIHQVLI